MACGSEDHFPLFYFIGKLVGSCGTFTLTVCEKLIPSILAHPKIAEVTARILMTLVDLHTGSEVRRCSRRQKNRDKYVSFTWLLLGGLAIIIELFNVSWSSWNIMSMDFIMKSELSYPSLYLRLKPVYRVPEKLRHSNYSSDHTKRRISLVATNTCLSPNTIK